MTACSILISNYFGGAALELTIESIFKRTAYSNYQVIVCDSSRQDSQDRQYLRMLKSESKIELLESNSLLKHGEAIWRLLNYCRTPLAVLLDSDVMIIRPDWLGYLINQYEADRTQVGLATYQPENAIPDRFWRMPRYLPMCVLLNMDIYRGFMHPDDWMEAYFPWKDCQQKGLFEKFSSHPYMTIGLKRSIEIQDNQVFGDTGWRFCERINLENKGKLEMAHLSYAFYQIYIHHWGAISIYNADLEHPQVKDKLPKIKKELERLRYE
jgi:hypothetical protein